MADATKWLEILTFQIFTGTEPDVIVYTLPLLSEKCRYIQNEKGFFILDDIQLHKLYRPASHQDLEVSKQPHTMMLPPPCFIEGMRFWCVVFYFGGFVILLLIFFVWVWSNCVFTVLNKFIRSSIYYSDIWMIIMITIFNG